MSRFTDALDAWHGSHADFDEFRDDKINTGEGAQVYGHGHYVGEAKGTGEQYRDSVSRKHGALRGMYFTGPHATSPVVKIEDLVGAYDRAVMGGPSGTLRSRLRDIGASHLNDDELQVMMNALATAVDNPDIHPQEHIDYGLDHHQEILDSDPDGDDEEMNEARTYIAAHPKITKIFENLKQGTGGRLYELKLDLSEPHIIDWEEQLQYQHPEVLGKLKAVSSMDVAADHLKNMSAGDFYKSILSGVNGHGSPQAASKALLDAGIHAIRYKDQFSRGNIAPDIYLDGQQIYKKGVRGLDLSLSHLDPEDQVALYDINVRGQYGVDTNDKLRRHYEEVIKDYAGTPIDPDDPSRGILGPPDDNHYAVRTLKWLDKNEHRLRVEPGKPTYNYVVFDPKLIKMVRKYDDRGNVVHDYTQASGTELRPVDHDPFAEEKK